MELSIIIVNWNSKDYLRKCLESFLDEIFNIEYEILVIDGGSFDGCDRMLQQRFPQVRFIQSHKNIGFGRANNMAFDHSSGRTILFLNPDTEVEGGAIRALWNTLESHPDAAIAGGKLLNPDRTLQETCVRAFPNILSEILDADVVIRRFPRSRLFGLAPLSGRDDLPVDVEAVSGACLMIRRSVFESIGRFSPEFFMYSEDIDLCYKAKRAGWKTYYVPRAVVVHHGGTSTAQSDQTVFASVMILESRWRFFKKYRSRLYCFLYRLSMLLSCASRVLIIWVSCHFIRGNNASQTLRMHGTRKKWIARLRWTLCLEHWVKDFA